MLDEEALRPMLENTHMIGVGPWLFYRRRIIHNILENNFGM